MTEQKENKPTKSELEILQVLWKEEPLSVRDVNDILNKDRKVGYTTTLKIMQLMYEKSLLTRKNEGKKHIYFTNVNEQDIQKNMLDKFLNRTFNGSAYSLVMEALGNYRASKEELEAIKQLIEKIEGGQK
ncbi:BlaI/MecI/CopY family transcriptional regulator [Hyphobacterium sp. CCMP332]|nr:BlaI/MecI/CopY family transcriptional regulator [Hyphobacterium sp. CCMP332]